MKFMQLIDYDKHSKETQHKFSYQMEMRIVKMGKVTLGR